ncbi:uncharacterized protein BX664DRAFT_359278 [Halteromyces radiatus]|uniref:uncharacterized protein n=1 Tax=Halteromyces radiatus TaxID=101107 RepID=UPI00221EA2D8|nr:uncharacterized protein BX664DRAFT_359278 [Halteromyces radiatus]KAI8089761.1 hypothetical protein BX664DRAFT_359278 [Halteromyces radiatus]
MSTVRSSNITSSGSDYVTSKTLPHLPKGVRVPKLHANTKPIIAGEWNEDENASQQMQLMMPGQQGGGRRELQPFHAGVSRSDQRSGNQEPPPIFASQPKRSFTLKRPTKVQQHIYRMSGGIEPVDLLCDRLSVWRLALKDLSHMFNNIIDAETKVASGYAASNKPLSIPFRESNNQFLHSGGIQDVWISYRNFTIEKSMMHHEYVGYLKSAVIPSLNNLKRDIKEFVKSIEKDPCLRSSILYHARQRADDMVNHLDNAIKYVYHSPDNVGANEDPALLNLGVIQAFKSLFNEENNLHANVIQLQREAATVEQRIIGSLNVISKNWENYCLLHRTDAKTIVSKITATFANIKPNSDWNEFIRRNQFQLVNEKATYKTDDEMQYTNQNHDLCIPVKVNFLNRRTAMKKWKEGLYVLTPTGYLHGFKHARHFETDPLSPEISIFLPHTTVSSTDEQAEDLSFQISGRKKALVGQKVFVFQANDEADLADWYSEAQRLSEVNTQYETLEVEGVPPALPGMEPEEREEEYANIRRLTDSEQQNRLIDQGNEQQQQQQQQRPIDSSDDEEHYDNVTSNKNNLSTAAVLPDNMVSSSQSNPPQQTNRSYSPRLQQGTKTYSPRLQQQSSFGSTGRDSPKVLSEDGEKHAVNDQPATGSSSVPKNVRSSPKVHDEGDFVQRYNDRLSMDDDNEGDTSGVGLGLVGSDIRSS